MCGRDGGCRRLRGIHWLQGKRGRVHRFPPQVGTVSVSQCARRLAGAAAPVHVLFFKEVWLLSGTSGTKARLKPSLLGERPRHLK